MSRGRGEGRKGGGDEEMRRGMEDERWKRWVGQPQTCWNLPFGDGEKWGKVGKNGTN